MRGLLSGPELHTINETVGHSPEARERERHLKAINRLYKRQLNGPIHERQLSKGELIRQ
jgi:hypothetical protein